MESGMSLEIQVGRFQGPNLPDSGRWKMLNIEIKTIPHDQQRYPTVGDYWIDPKSGKLQIMVSEMGDWRYEALVAFHELAEYLQITHQDISIEEIDRFDIDYEASRGEGDFSEPGDSPLAPYHKAHLVATDLESVLAMRLGVDWAEYDKRVCSL